MHHALNPDQYRGVFGSDGEKYAKDVQEIIDFGTSGHAAAFISEAIQVNALRSFIQAYKGTSLILYYRWWYSKYSKYSKLSIKHFKWQGVGGILELAPGYLPAVYKSIRQADGLCIADEVQSRFARRGCHFWGFEAHGVVPDIITVAKVTNYSANPVLTWQRRGFRVQLADAMASTSLPALRDRSVGVQPPLLVKHWGGGGCFQTLGWKEDNTQTLGVSRLLPLNIKA